MSLLEKTIPQEADTSTLALDHQNVSEKHDDMTFIMRTINTQTSSMSEEQKMKKREASASLQDLFRSTVENKGELDALKSHWTTNDELEIEGISDMTFHSFLLKAEALGKKITYTRSFKVEITD